MPPTPNAQPPAGSPFAASPSAAKKRADPPERVKRPARKRFGRLSPSTSEEDEDEDYVYEEESEEEDEGQAEWEGRDEEEDSDERKRRPHPSSRAYEAVRDGHLFHRKRVEGEAYAARPVKDRRAFADALRATFPPCTKHLPSFDSPKLQNAGKFALLPPPVLCQIFENLWQVQKGTLPLCRSLLPFTGPLYNIISQYRRGERVHLPISGPPHPFIFLYNMFDALALQEPDLVEPLQAYLIDPPLEEQNGSQTVSAQAANEVLRTELRKVMEEQGDWLSEEEKAQLIDLLVLPTTTDLCYQHVGFYPPLYENGDKGWVWRKLKELHGEEMPMALDLLSLLYPLPGSQPPETVRFLRHPQLRRPGDPENQQLEIAIGRVLADYFLVVSARRLETGTTTIAGGRQAKFAVKGLQEEAIKGLKLREIKFEIEYGAYEGLRGGTATAAMHLTVDPSNATSPSIRSLVLPCAHWCTGIIIAQLYGSGRYVFGLMNIVDGLEALYRLLARGTFLPPGALPLFSEACHGDDDDSSRSLAACGVYHTRAQLRSSEEEEKPISVSNIHRDIIQSAISRGYLLGYPPLQATSTSQFLHLLPPSAEPRHHAMSPLQYLTSAAATFGRLSTLQQQQHVLKDGTIGDGLAAITEKRLDTLKNKVVELDDGTLVDGETARTMATTKTLANEVFIKADGTIGNGLHRRAEAGVRGRAAKRAAEGQPTKVAKRIKVVGPATTTNPPDKPAPVAKERKTLKWTARFRASVQEQERLYGLTDPVSLSNLIQQFPEQPVLKTLTPALLARRYRDHKKTPAAASPSLTVPVLASTAVRDPASAFLPFPPNLSLLPPLPLLPLAGKIATPGAQAFGGGKMDCGGYRDEPSRVSMAEVEDWEFESAQVDEGGCAEAETGSAGYEAASPGREGGGNTEGGSAMLVDEWDEQQMEATTSSTTALDTHFLVASSNHAPSSPPLSRSTSPLHRLTCTDLVSPLTLEADQLGGGGFDGEGGEEAVDFLDHPDETVHPTITSALEQDPPDSPPLHPVSRLPTFPHPPSPKTAIPNSSATSPSSSSPVHSTVPPVHQVSVILLLLVVAFFLGVLSSR